jgi:phage gpG-like protein
MITITLIGETQLLARIDGIPAAVASVIRAKVQALRLKLEALVKKKLSGQVLNVRSGALRRSIASKVEAVARAIYGIVFSSGDVKYARIHELGGLIKHPGGTAYMTNYAGGVGNTKWVSNASPLAAHLPRTKPHDIPMPKRSYLRSSLKDMAVEISTGLKEAAIKGASMALKGQTP